MEQRKKAGMALALTTIFVVLIFFIGNVNAQYTQNMAGYPGLNCQESCQELGRQCVATIDRYLPSPTNPGAYCVGGYSTLPCDFQPDTYETLCCACGDLLQCEYVISYVAMPSEVYVGDVIPSEAIYVSVNINLDDCWGSNWRGIYVKLKNDDFGEIKSATTVQSSGSKSFHFSGVEFSNSGSQPITIEAMIDKEFEFDEVKDSTFRSINVLPKTTTTVNGQSTTTTINGNGNGNGDGEIPWMMLGIGGLILVGLYLIYKK